MKELSVEEVKSVQLEILKVVDKWCRENNVNYFLSYGTLLGAVRHGGYIPWDDDIDISMLRKDYNRFIKEFNSNRTDNYKVLHSSIDKDFPYEFSKVEDLSTKLVENTDVKYEIGINIDVFPMDNLGSSIENGKKLYKKIQFPIYVFNRKLVKPNKSLKNRIAKFCAKFFSMYWCTSKIDKIARKYENSQEDKYFSDICQRWYSPELVFEKSWFTNLTDMDFEGCKFKVPVEYDKVLTVFFGDYMTPPPEEERITHHDYKAYLL